MRATTIANQGFSIGISDVTPGKRLREIKDEQVAQAYSECDEVIAKLKAGQLETMPGCNEEQTMEVMQVRQEYENDVLTNDHVVHCLWHSLCRSWCSW